MASQLSRRSFLRVSAMVGAASLLAACQPKIVEVEKIVKETVEVVKEVEKEVVKEVPKTVVVEKTVVVRAEVEPAELTYMGWGAGAEQDAVVAGIEKFQEAVPNVTVNWVANAYNMHLDKLLAMSAAGTPPDTAYIPAEFYAKFAEAGVLFDITDKLNADPVLGQNGYFVAPEYERSIYKGRWFGIGFCALAGHMYYNAEILAAEGIEPPSNDPAEAWSWDDFLTYANQLTIDLNGQHPSDPGFDPENIERWGVHYGGIGGIVGRGVVMSNEGAIVNPATGLVELDQPAALEAVQALADLQLTKFVQPNASTLEALGMGTSQLLETGKLAMTVDGQWALSYLKDLPITLGTAVAPAMKVPACDMTSPFQGMLRGTPNVDAAWQWLAFLAGPWYQQQLCSIGLWLPNQTSLLTEQGLTNWITPGVHPEGYELIATKYVADHGQSVFMPEGYLEGWQQYLKPAMDAINIGDMTAADALPPAVVKANDIISRAAAS